MKSVPQDRLNAFLRLLAHDIRNDLNAIDLLSSYVQEISSEPQVVSEVQQVRSAAKYAAKRMIAVANTLQPVEVETIPYSLQALHEDFGAHFMKCEPDLCERVDFAGWEEGVADCLVQVDVGLLFEALTELVRNALGFSAAEKRVVVSVGVDVIEGAGGKSGVWEVEQECAAVPEELQTWGVEIFVSTRRGHYGIGLYRVRKILEKQGALLSYSLDRGAAFLSSRVRLAGGMQQ